jgi:CubicO group peptidase (beta-lactamase class C family)
MSGGLVQDELKQARPRSRLVWIAVVTFLVPIIAVVILALAQPGLERPGQALPSAGPDSDWPTEGWSTSTPEEQWMDSDQLEAMMAYVDEHNVALDSILVVRHGRLVFEEYGEGSLPGRAHELYSVTKSVTSMLVGIALDAGLIEGLDVPLTELLPHHTMANLDGRKERIRLEHLLTMSDGLDWNEHKYPYGDSRNPVRQMGSSPDILQFVLDQPMAREPGEAWAYNSGASILLGGIVEEATGRSVLDFAREALFDPLGIGHIYWSMGPGGHYATHGGLSMTPRDMARLGYLMLRNGTWDGKEIVSADWVARSTTAHYRVQGAHGYGYQWWILPEGQGYRAHGLYDQNIIVLPEADMVVVATARIPGGSFQRVEGLLNSFILPACTDLPAASRRATYEEYGFTLEYPAGFRLEEAPIPGRDAVSDLSGVVQITSNTEPLEILSLLWDGAEAGPDAAAFLDLYLAGLTETGVGVAPGEPAEGEKDGHTMALRFSELTLEGGAKLPAISGAWICDRANRFFAATYLPTVERTPEDLQASLEDYLERLTCH